MKKIALLNVYGSKNIGDEAINIVATDLLINALKKGGEITYLAVEERPSFVSKKVFVDCVLSPYGIAIHQGKEKLSPIQKIMAFIEVITVTLIISICLKYFASSWGKNTRYAFVHTLYEADAVVSMGGGYLRTKKSWEDLFGLTLTLLPIYLAKFFHKKNLFLPMSFGNFANDFHKRIALHTLSNSIFFARDEITYNEISNDNLHKDLHIDLRLSPDLALFFTEKKMSTLEKKPFLILSAREWLPPAQQKQYEKSLVTLIEKAYKKYKLKTVFIAMAANSIEDDDRIVARRLMDQIQDSSIFTLSDAQDPYEVLTLLQQATVCVCTRMHSAILSSLMATPFVTIQYEHKTLGFMKSLDLEAFNIPIETTHAGNVFALLEKVMKKEVYSSIQSRLKQRRKEYTRYKQNMQETVNDFIDHA